MTSRRVWVAVGIVLAVLCFTLMAVDIVNNPEGPRSDRRSTPLAH